MSYHIAMFVSKPLLPLFSSGTSCADLTKVATKRVKPHNYHGGDLLLEVCQQCMANLQRIYKPVFTVTAMSLLFLLGSSSHGNAFITVVFFISTICTVCISSSSPHSSCATSTYNTTRQIAGEKLDIWYHLPNQNIVTRVSSRLYHTYSSYAHCLLHVFFPFSYAVAGLYPPGHRRCDTNVLLNKCHLLSFFSLLLFLYHQHSLHSGS